jgi:hypothetical protein
MDGVQAERLRGTFDAILFNGSTEDLRALLAPLGECTRTCLYESRNNELRCDQSPLEYCISKRLADHAAVLFEYGASAAALTIQGALSDAVAIATSYRCIRILEVVVAAAQSQNCLAEVMHRLYHHGARTASSLDRVLAADSAPVFGILLDAGLGSADTIPRSPSSAQPPGTTHLRVCSYFMSAAHRTSGACC